MAEFKLPASSYKELIKIIQAYGANTKGASLDDISKATTIHKVVISKNSKFLVGTGIIAGGNSKTPTEIGTKLGRAITFKNEDDISSCWREIIAESDFMNSMITAVRIKDGMPESDLIAHIEYSSGQKKTNESRAGSGTLTEILKKSKLIEEKDGKLIATNITNTSSLNSIEDDEPEVKKTTTASPPTTEESNSTKGLTKNIQTKIGGPNNAVTININIQLSVPETTDEKVYHKFFEAMKKHLLS